MNFVVAQLKWSLLLVPSLFVLTASLPAQKAARPFSEPVERTPSRSDPYEFDQWSFPVAGSHFELKRDATGRRRSSRGQSTRFRLKVESDEEINRVYYSEYKGDLLLLCELNAGGYGSGFVVRMDSQTLRQKWRVQIPAFNVSQALIEDNSVYLGATGFAGKLDLDSGRYLWKHDDFYRKYHKDGAFNIFELPRIVGNEVVYTEKQEMFNRKPNIIRFNKKTGKVLKVDLNT
jgi:hypothetical protein